MTSGAPGVPERPDDDGRWAVPVRLGGVLLLLAAVFLMHGLTCTAAEGSGAGPALAGSSTGEPGSHLLHPASSTQSLPGGHAPTAVGTVAVPWAAGAATVPPHPVGHSDSLHTLMVCLAVVAAAAGGVIAGGLALRRRGGLPPPPRRGAALTRWSRDTRIPDQLRPDLMRLCLLRI